MAKFRVDSIADLARQMAFAPHETRAAQVTSAEELLHLIDPAKAYPLEFVIFKITGYHPKGDESGDLLTGLALQHDLGLLVEQVSDTLDVRTDSLSEPVLQIDDVCERFNVTSKTIQRWRRKGLPARKFLFADGKRRVGFLLGSVERFFRSHRDQVERGANFSQVSDEERDTILRKARTLALRCQCCVNEIARRIGRKLRRSPLTILHTIKKHDEENPDKAIFPHAPPELAPDERERVLKSYRRGIAIGTLATRMCRRRSAIYRVLLQERVARLNRKKVRFIDDPLYHGEGAAEAIDAIVNQGSLAAKPTAEETRVPRDLPAYLQELYRTPLLTPAKEGALFLKFNFHKFQFVQARRRLDPELARSRDLQELEGHLRAATETKNAIVKANLRLVVSIARKHLRPGLALMELISEGNITLMRAVEGFDVHRGHRFSTYATLALMKGFARSVPAMQAGMMPAGTRATSDVRVLLDVADTRHTGADDRWMARDEVQRLLSRLDEREREVLLAHYGLGGREAAGTYEELGRQLGLSKQRVRQIEQGAMAKLRQVVGATPAA